MYRSQPDYFSRVHQEAHNRWNQLEADQVEAAPWHQFFSQVCYWSLD